MSGSNQGITKVTVRITHRLFHRLPVGSLLSSQPSFSVPASVGRRVEEAAAPAADASKGDGEGTDAAGATAGGPEGGMTAFAGTTTAPSGGAHRVSCA